VLFVHFLFPLGAAVSLLNINRKEINIQKTKENLS